MSFIAFNRPLKIHKFIKIINLKVEAHLGVWSTFPHILLYSWEHEM
jgi:hypothetical protein